VPDLRISTLEDLCTALDRAASAAEVRMISSAWSRWASRAYQSWGDELIYDAYRAFDKEGAP
jgi:hypothetical protein